MVWIDRVPFPAVVGALAAGLALGIWLSRLWLGLPGLVVSPLVVGILTVLYLRDYLRRPGPVAVPAKRRASPAPGPASPVDLPPEPRRIQSEPVEPIPDDLSDEEDPVLEADRIESNGRSPSNDNAPAPPGSPPSDG
ncbi:MAG: hypothetical protein L3K03_05720 [Thermoplasmata archaeon]|nr:hypothetical protein [Thermoplasmata archaeon]